MLVIGLGLGGYISQYSIQTNHGFGALTIGQWTAWPAAGSVKADPYTKAKVAAEGEVPLGAAEGIAFHATTDEAGMKLRLRCQYRLSGQTPLARFWTISIHNLDGGAGDSGNKHYSTLLSQSLVREADGRFVLHTGPTLTAGNWLETDGQGEFQLILRLYDSPITSTRGIVDPGMPSINLLECKS
ncbi:MAG: DUF1214 domain-containing protein [Rhizobiaceae bacterium]